MAVTTLIFDFGNVLALFDHGLTLARLAAHTDMTAAQMRAAFYDGDLEDAFEAARISAAEFLTQVRSLARLRCDEDFLAASFMDIFTPNEAVCQLIPQLAQRYRLILCSNTNELHSRQFLRQLAPTLQHFAFHGLSFEAGVRKPKHEFFAYCQRHAAAPPEECLFVDDLPANTASAAAFGWRTITYLPGSDLAPQLQAHGVVVQGV